MSITIGPFAFCDDAISFSFLLQLVPCWLRGF